MATKNIILVEGLDDLNVVKRLYGTSDNDLPFEIREAKGIEKLIQALPVQLKESKVARLGVIVDADENAENRWHQLRDIFRKAGYAAIPPQPNKTGTLITQAGKPHIGVWIMPDNSLPGTLDNFLSRLIPPEDLLWPKAQQDVAAIPTEHRKFSEPDTIKAKMHTWLAWQAEPGKPYGIAIRAKFLDANAPHAQDFMNWLNRLLTA